MTLTTKDFSYTLPAELIAQQPSSTRDGARLLVSRDGALFDSQIADIGEFLPQDSLIVRNNSRVIPSRLLGHTIYGGKIEIMLLEPKLSTSSCSWQAIGKPFKKLKEGAEVYFQDLKATVIGQHKGLATPYLDVEFDCSWQDFHSWIDQQGYIPLPPYIKRAEPLPAAASADTSRYQTVYAGPRGSVAAPTAGLHFTNPLFERLTGSKNISCVDITLHVGAGTFLPVKTDRLEHHEMHWERFLVSESSLAAIDQAKADGRPVFALGTTTMRCLESLGRHKDPHSLAESWQKTNLFIYPKIPSERYQPRYFDGLITNFHQSESTLYMLISALVGYQRAKQIYAHAIAEKYRFFSYGDSSLLFFQD